MISLSPPLMSIASYIQARRLIIESALEGFLPSEKERPTTLHQAMRHSMFAGGKRLRPILLIAAAEAASKRPFPADEIPQNVITAACAVECLHTYTLIHDDLPSMDDDDFRRGHPTCHKVFGEGVAILAGDALQTLAFELLAQTAPGPGHRTADLILDLAQASGSRRLVGGQVLDLEGEGKKISPEDLKFIHESKTAALLEASLKIGGRCVDATAQEIDALACFGYHTGLAFQIIDDILDITQTSETLGKSAGKDQKVEKATWPALHGLEASRQEAKYLTQKATQALEIFGTKADALRALAANLSDREY